MKGGETVIVAITEEEAIFVTPQLNIENKIRHGSIAFCCCNIFG